MTVFCLLCPHPGTKVYEIFKDEGLLNFDHILDPSLPLKNKDFEEIGLRLAGRGAKTKYYTPEELQQYLSLAYRCFFKARLKNSLNPIRTIQKLRSIEDLKYIYKIGKVGIKTAIESIGGKTFMSQSLTKYRKKDIELEDG